MFQILVMQYRLFIHKRPFFVFSYMFWSSRYEHYWLFRIFPAPICIVGSETNPWITASIVDTSYEIPQIIICTSWKHKISTPEAVTLDLGCPHGSVAPGGSF